jgi:hypothetical protein
VVLLTALIAVGGLLVVRQFGKEKPGPNVYATVRIVKVPPYILSTPPPVVSREDDFENYRLTQAAMVKSRTTLNAALHDPTVAPLSVVKDQGDLIAWLQDNLKVDFQLAPEVMRVGLDGGQPEEMVILVDAVVNAYLNATVDAEMHRKHERLDQMKTLYNEYEQQLNSQRRILREQSKELGDGSASPLHREILLQDLLRCKQELLRVRLARAAGGSQAGKDKDAPPADSALAAQELLLREDEKQLLAKAELLDGGKRIDSAEFRREMELNEEITRRVGAEVKTLKIEIDAAPRVTLMDHAVARRAK